MLMLFSYIVDDLFHIHVTMIMHLRYAICVRMRERDHVTNSREDLIYYGQTQV